MARVLVLGNEKGGSGKSTVAMHAIVWLARAGASVAAIDLDVRQRSVARYLDNRRSYTERHGIPLRSPREYRIEPSDAPLRAEAERQDCENLEDAVAALARNHDWIVIDCPGAQTPLALAAHDLADTLITPINDSFMDLDLLAQVDPATGDILGPSIYAEVVWNARKARTMAGRPATDWIVMRNRIGMLDARNRRRVHGSLDQLAERIGFRLVPGFSERVIFRELFLHGLTLLDLGESGSRGLTRLSLSHVAARQELRELAAAANLPPEPS